MIRRSPNTVNYRHARHVSNTNADPSDRIPADATILRTCASAFSQAAATRSEFPGPCQSGASSARCQMFEFD
jgi:hypothetical protein